MTIPLPRHPLVGDDMDDVRWETVNGILTLVHNRPSHRLHDGRPFLCAVQGVIDTDGFLYCESGDYDPLTMTSLQQARRSLWLKPKVGRMRQFIRSIEALWKAQDKVSSNADSFLPETTQPGRRWPLLVFTRSWGRMADSLVPFKLPNSPAEVHFTMVYQVVEGKEQISGVIYCIRSLRIVP
ncbi:hypothetical protein BDN72DRAFT_865397 [Pluteus cervinus]|uniref:Uncharacterized protein n=1 Tax=Pluteus cervinus TaxID=181527 RepID=A0ACD3A0K2_9AGAR|nr:hypothetical protein BDN72DRAFT_865397 [Pluteus cervinus]